MTPAIRWLRLVAALVAWGALLVQFGLSMQAALADGRGIGGGLLRYFGYFTILTNLFLALVLVGPWLFARSRAGHFFGRPSVASSAAASIVLVALAYHILLRHLWNPTGWALATDTALHYINPVLFVAYWWLAVPKGDLTWRGVPAWALFPAVYFLYVLVRGALIGSYPYPFLDVNALGYALVILNGTGLLLAYLVIAGGLLVVGRVLPAPSTSRAGQALGES